MKPSVAMRGFTLIEIAVVLVIIGLIVGGVLMGQDLIRAAAVRAQISQIEKFNQAANTFYGKYGYLPGDIPAAPAAQFGFASRGQYAGEGDGNGLIEGNWNNTGSGDWGLEESSGETVMFWVDLSSARLIDGQFNTAQANSPASGCGGSYSSDYNGNTQLYPIAQLGGFIQVWSGSGTPAPTTHYFNSSSAGHNFFAIGGVSAVCAGGSFANPTLTVAQSYAIDSKVDDGLPESGTVEAILVNNGCMWASTGLGCTDPGTEYNVSATSGSCMDNGSTAGNAMRYSISVNNGTGVNCALSFKMQAGD